MKTKKNILFLLSLALVTGFTFCNKAESKQTTEDSSAISEKVFIVDKPSADQEDAAVSSDGLQSETTATSQPTDKNGNPEATGEQIDQPLIPRETEAPQKTSVKEGVPVGVRALMEAYPKNIVHYRDGNLVFADGTTLKYDDGREKDFEDMLDNSSPKDMFYKPYKKVRNGEKPEYLADAGRSRSEALFKKMYGSSSAAVNKNMVKVNWFGQSLPFTSVNGAAEQLKKVAAELAQHPEYKKYLKSAGTFYWRPVRGAKRLSAHSYGIAIDIGVGNSDYWLWKNKGAKELDKISYSNHIPSGIADIFAKYGFIWGGDWYHFDTMHFEYRPEILRYAELAN